MRVHLSAPDTVTLLEPDNFRALDVLIEAADPATIAALIARVGTLEGTTHVRLSPAALRALAPQNGTPDWDKGFEAMLAYAAKAGWVDDSGAVRAHIVAE